MDVYIPHNKISGFFGNVKAKFIKLFCYDVNALYPSVMANTLMPVGKPIAFEGDIRLIEPSAFGFFFCKITSPEYLEHPILQRRIKTSDGVRTIAGLGSWVGWIYSPEMDNAIKHGYTFEILKGYQFDKANIFKEYVETMYNLRLQYPKGTPMNLIAKLLMNSLYGKFGMKLENTIIDIFNTSNKKDLQLFEELLDTHGTSIQDFIKIDNHYLIIRKNNIKYEDDEDMYHGLDVNIAIASAITGGARMWMSLIKNNPDFNLFYSDTDSAVIDAPLPGFMVGSALGQFKLEYVTKKAVFIAPKVYALITEEDSEIVKVKGLTANTVSTLNFDNIESLLHKDSTRELSQSKYLKKVIEGDISITDVAYSLKVTSNKRELIYENDVK